MFLKTAAIFLKAIPLSSQRTGLLRLGFVHIKFFRCNSALVTWNHFSPQRHHYKVSSTSRLFLSSHLTPISNPSTVAETEKKKARNSLQKEKKKISCTISLRPSSQEDFLILLPEFLVNGFHTNPHYSSSCVCKSDFTIKKSRFKIWEKNKNKNPDIKRKPALFFK